MKRSPDMQRLEELLRSGQLVEGGFLGDDPRPVEEIIEADAAELERRGLTAAALGRRMAEVTEAARPGLGTFVDVDQHLQAAVDDNRGQIVCPFPGEARVFKTVTTARRRDADRQVRYSDLCTHMIAEHGFFQGQGSRFRLEPGVLADVLFPQGPPEPSE